MAGRSWRIISQGIVALWAVCFGLSRLSELKNLQAEPEMLERVTTISAGARIAMEWYSSVVVLDVGVGEPVWTEDVRTTAVMW